MNKPRIDFESMSPEKRKAGDARLLRALANAPLVSEGEIEIHTKTYGLGHVDGKLTKQEKQVLFLASHGIGSKEIAKITVKSVHTIRSQFLRARYKLRAKTIAHAVATALRQGLLD